jgi:parallel beta-helix repeat protein
VIEGSVVLVQAEYVNVEGLTITNSPYPGVIIKLGSHHVSVSRCLVNKNGLGIWIGDGAGMENRILDNEVSFNKTQGIGVDLVNCSVDKETVIKGNRVFENGYHGIEVNGSYYIIEKNEVFRNGKDLMGTSGIHVYSLSPEEDSGDHNIIRYNVSHHHVALSGPDGSGIQLDQWCDFNQVYYNICFANDGAGIDIFDSANDYIYNNSLYGNMLDPGGDHPIKAELILASEFTRNVDHTDNVSVANNIIVATNPSSYAIYVDRLTSDNRLTIEKNLFFHSQGNAFYFWNGQTGKDIPTWNRFPGSVSNSYGDPQFIHSPPGSLVDFGLTSASPAIKAGKSVGATHDILGQAVSQDTDPDLGAIQFQASATPTPPINARVSQVDNSDPAP